MRRMYSEQELTKIIGEVFDAKIEAGAFDDSISDAVDAYLVEHPVDITALEGKTIAPAVINATTSVNAPSGAFTNLSVTTAASIFAQIQDADSHSRFTGGNLSLSSGLENLETYAKWSLSGTHLLVVLAFDVEVDSVVGSNYGNLASVALPSWIASKIKGFGGGNYLIFEPALKGYTSSYVALSQTLPYSINIDDIYLLIRYQSDTPITFTQAGSFRIQLDLLID